MIYNYFEDIKVGDKVVTRGRTITEADVVLFCMLTGNWLELHSNAEFAKTTQFGERLVQGSLVLSLVPGLLPFSPAGIIIASYGIDKVRYTAPVKIGDTIYAETEIVAKEKRGKDRGVVTQNIMVKDQRGEIVQTSVWKYLVAIKKPNEE